MGSTAPGRPVFLSPEERTRLNNRRAGVIQTRAKKDSSFEQCLAEVDELRLFCWRIEHYEILGKHYWRLETTPEYYDKVIGLLWYLELGSCTGA